MRAVAAQIEHLRHGADNPIRGGGDDGGDDGE
jgi:hypothetical protein